MTHQRWRGDRAFCGVVSVTLLTLALSAQEPNKPEQNVAVLQPKTMNGVERGKIAVAEGNLARGEQRFSVQDLDVMQPVAVGLFATDPSRPLRAQIVKGGWDQIFRDCVTDATGKCDLRFRTQGNFGIRVTPTGATPAKYTIAAWVGDEVHDVPANLLTPAAPAAGWRGLLRPTVLATGIGGVAALGAIAWVALMRARGKVRT